MAILPDELTGGRTPAGRPYTSHVTAPWSRCQGPCEGVFALAGKVFHSLEGGRPNCSSGRRELFHGFFECRPPFRGGGGGDRVLDGSTYFTITCGPPNPTANWRWTFTKTRNQENTKPESGSVPKCPFAVSRTRSVGPPRHVCVCRGLEWNPFGRRVWPGGSAQPMPTCSRTSGGASRVPLHLGYLLQPRK
jgi:hypothetical protein